MTLFPNNNTPRDKATYTFTIDAPTMLATSNYASAGGKPYQAGVVSNGELLVQDARTATAPAPPGCGTRPSRWPASCPWSRSAATTSTSPTSTSASGRTIHEWTFIDPAISVANQTTTLATRAQLKAVLDFYESKYGPYPGNSTGLVTDVVPSAINYALETQDRPFFPNSASRGTTYHEIMHQWWGDSVAPTDWNDITLNEGPATVLRVPVPLRGGRFHDHHDRAGQLHALHLTRRHEQHLHRRAGGDDPGLAAVRRPGLREGLLDPRGAAHLDRRRRPSRR